MKEIVNFLFEVGVLSKTPRSGLFLLGTGTQSVSEHVLRVIFIGYSLASMEEHIDMTKVLKMCLLHDIAETRVSDLNYVHQKYVESREEEAINDLVKTLSFGNEMKEIIEEYEKRESTESIIAKDADNIEWILTLKEEVDKGNKRAESWIESAVKRLKTDKARKIAQEILKTNSEEWWFGDKNDSWWVSRNKE